MIPRSDSQYSELFLLALIRLLRGLGRLLRRLVQVVIECWVTVIEAFLSVPSLSPNTNLLDFVGRRGGEFTRRWGRHDYRLRINRQ